MGTIGPISVSVTEKAYPFGDERSYDRLIDNQSKYVSRPRNFWDPLPYSRYVHKVQSASGPLLLWATSNRALPFLGDLNAEEQRCRQAAYAKLVGKVKAVQNGWGENLGQRKQTFEMMLLRIRTLTQAARALKRGDVRGFCKALGVTKSRTRSKAKKASEIWLEYHFGWEPLYKDIYTGCRELGRNLPWGVVSASSIEKTQRAGRNSISGGNFYAQGETVVKLSGAYHADSPGLYLLNSLGVINPISVAWELVPFSFAVDWFFPVGQYLQSLTDFVGVSRSREFTTVYKLGYLAQDWPSAFSVRTLGVDCRRTLGVSAGLPTFKLYRGFSVVRGATAIALLTGMLKSLG